MTANERHKRWRLANPKRLAEMRSQSAARYNPSPKGRFTQQKRGAKTRGIEFLFTLDQWLSWWGADYPNRGPKGTDLCMARRGDVGPYSPSNCVKITNRLNNKHGRRRALNG